LVVLINYRNPKGENKKERGGKVDQEVPKIFKVDTYRTNLFKFSQFLIKHCISLELDDDKFSL
jgi:hypothetical protein